MSKNIETPDVETPAVEESSKKKFAFNKKTIYAAAGLATAIAAGTAYVVLKTKGASTEALVELAVEAAENVDVPA